MTRLRKLSASLLAIGACSAVFASPSMAIIGGSDAPAGAYPSAAEIYLGFAFGCTGTLISPTWVMTAGHCGSITGGAGVASPISFPPQAIEVYLGSNKTFKGRRVAVKRVVIPPEYLGLVQGYDISLLELTAPASGITPAPLAGAALRDIWEPGDVETIAGWGNTSTDGEEYPDTLQHAQVPIVSDATCREVYDSYGFESDTQVCAGYLDGSVDSCQGDSGGPMYGRNAVGALRLVGATSYGEGCAEPGFPGVYARVADTVLREWVRRTAGAVAVDG